MKRIWKSIIDWYNEQRNETWYAFLIALLVAGIAVFLISIPKWGLKGCYGHFEAVLPNLYSSLFDIFVLGIVVSLITMKQEKKKNIKRWKEEIDDYRLWKQPEAMYRIVGNVKRLSKQNIINLNLSGCFMNGAALSKINLIGANLFRADLTGAKLTGADLTGAQLIDADLTGAKLTGTKLTRADLTKAVLTMANLDGAQLAEATLNRAKLTAAKLNAANLESAQLHEAEIDSANLTEANLFKANLSNSDLSMAVLTGINLTEADLRNAKNIDVDKLLKAATLYKTKMDANILYKIRAKKPELLATIWDENTFGWIIDNNLLQEIKKPDWKGW